MRSFTGPDGTNWRVDVQSPGSSNAMVVFRHPDGRTNSLDRYAWFITKGAEAHDVTARLNKRTVSGFAAGYRLSASLSPIDARDDGANLVSLTSL